MSQNGLRERDDAEEATISSTVRHRGHGEGSMRERGPGHWLFRVYDPEAGRQVSKTISPDLGPVLKFAVLVGVRRGELCGLRWNDVDWERQQLSVQRSVWQVRSSWGLKGPKSHRQRSIALDSGAMELLGTRYEQAKAEVTMAAVELPGDAYIWSTQVDGRTPRTPNSLTRAFHRLCRALEDEARALGRDERWQFRLHDLRHLSVTEWLGAGVDVATVARRHGHADATMTLRVYSHPVAERERQGAEPVGQRFAPPPSRQS